VCGGLGGPGGLGGGGPTTVRGGGGGGARPPGGGHACVAVSAQALLHGPRHDILACGTWNGKHGEDLWLGAGVLGRSRCGGRALLR
jgi:hypothetical protein